MPTKVIFLRAADASPWAKPADCTGVLDKVEIIGAGQYSTANGNSGAGGDYVSATNVSVGATTNFSIGVPGNPSGDTWFVSAATLLAKGGGSATASVGTVVNAGGAARAPVAVGKISFAYAGGGGAGGPHGAGNQAITPSSTSTPNPPGTADAGNAGRASLWTQTSDSAVAGAGDGGQSGAGNPSALHGVAGLSYGGGGGAEFSAPPVAGAPAIIVITYTTPLGFVASQNIPAPTKTETATVIASANALQAVPLPATTESAVDIVSFSAAQLLLLPATTEIIVDVASFSAVQNIPLPSKAEIGSVVVSFHA